MAVDALAVRPQHAAERGCAGDLALREQLLRDLGWVTDVFGACVLQGLL